MDAHTGFGFFTAALLGALAYFWYTNYYNPAGGVTPGNLTDVPAPLPSTNVPVSPMSVTETTSYV
jgi:hypothetical protein